MNITLNQILEFLNGLYGVPRVVLVLFICLAFCMLIDFVVRRLPFVPNYVIPIAIPCSVPLIGAILLPAVSEWQVSAIPTVRQFGIINAGIGLIAGTAAWSIHRYLLAGWISKLKSRDTDPNLRKSDLPPKDPPASPPMGRGGLTPEPPKP